MKRLGLLVLSVGALIWVARPSAPQWSDLAPSGAGEEPAGVSSVMDDVEFVAYEVGGRRYHVSAQAAVPSTLRLGFFRTALVPTVELQQAVVERTRPDGTIERIELPEAVVEWNSKTVRNASGRVIASTQAW